MEDYVKKNKINKKELIITIIVLILAVVIGIIGGKELYEAMYGKIQLKQRFLNKNLCFI